MLAVSSSSFWCSSPLFFGTNIPVESSPPAFSRVRLRPLRFSAAYTSTAYKTRPPYLSSPKMASSASLYEVLGIPVGASCQEIKAAYRRLARLCHPDVVAIDRKENSTDEFIKIHAAYSTLSDPQKRADYDCMLFNRQQRPFRSPTSTSTYRASSMSGFSGYSRRTWETDQCW
ncbi:PREDICTED: chaperone protein dnaJ 11, chloroplastic [Nelumbo nucifera]|uniref:J domain-containing protein n=2 Tax=Nelumbo nucifera TaxID=4432 RepID=A0A822Y986_NELNU|nr:PREDICTED: chaperone protein dnaJ 11, chloroplastic [Nelumbo nucifera]DAD22407.1 TPA_asm: hypothetical protein HUJ06_023870 [Nelumbo nucifera]DAD28977.1 TPA_asm: hypothetical protein HUJ06_030445 [Nelumbo nucifera]